MINWILIGKTENTRSSVAWTFKKHKFTKNDLKNLSIIGRNS